MGSHGAASLRDLYSSPSSTWSFIPPPQNASSPSIHPPSASDPTYQWSSRPAPNSIYDLSPGLNLEPTAPNAKLLLRTLFASAFLQYSSTAVAMPWEVGRMLLQVQYIPRTPNTVQEPERVVEEEEEEPSDESSNENEDSYFADATSTSVSRHHPPRQTDDQGYVVRQVAMDSSTRPDFVIPVASDNGVWAMMKRLGRWKSEGWLALWKGLLTSCITDFLSATIEPIVHSVLSSLLSITYSYPNSYATPHHRVIIPVTSHLITGLILSPLDLIRTRLIVQSSVARHRRYSGPLDALSQVLRDEGGFKGMYLHPQLLYPAILDCTARALVGFGVPGVVARLLGPRVTEETHPFLWGLAQLAGSGAGLLLTLPLETVRRRLQAQTRGAATPLRACVQLRRKPYYGIVDTLYTILAEERSAAPRHARRGSRSASHKGKAKEDREVGADDTDEGWLRSTGLGQLYHGLGTRMTASAIVLLLQTVTGTQHADDGWTEL